MKLSNVTFKFAEKRNVEVCECFGNEIHLIANPEFNERASCAYVVNKESGVLTLAMHWDDSVKSLPMMISDEKGLRKVIDQVAKSVYMKESN